jgi:hypothetical protein
MRSPKKLTHGMVAEFDSTEAILAAAEKAKEKGYTKIDCFTPFPVHGLSEAIGFKDQSVPWFFFIAACVGGLSGLALEWYTSVWDYPLSIGGKALFSLPSFVPVAYECTILFSAVGGTLFMIARNGLPQPHHPIFETPGFERASQDRFFLCVEAVDPLYDEKEVKKLLSSMKPLSISIVEETE